MKYMFGFAVGFTLEYNNAFNLPIVSSDFSASHSFLPL